MVRNPSYKKYVGSISAGPLYRMLAAENQILEFFAGYSSIDYFDPPLDPAEERDSDRLNTYMSWVWIFKKDAFFNLKYEFTNDDAEGSNWVNQGHDITLALTRPLIEKLSLQLSGEMFLQNYRNIHTFFDVKREDTTYVGSVGLTYALMKELNLVLQYTYSRVDSNLAIYDYDRSVYSAGLEFRF